MSIRSLPLSKYQKSFTSDAASAAIEANDLEAAVELLDRGREIMWSNMEGYRRPLDQLRDVNMQLADQFESVSLQLEKDLALSSESGPMNCESPTPLPRSQRCRILSEEWEKLLGQIREIDGFNNFLQAVPFTTLRTAAAEGPVIIVNVSKHRSDAIILHIDKPPILVALPDAQPEHLTHLGEELPPAPHPLGHRVDYSDLVYPILRDLWATIVSPVRDCLTELAVPRRSRIWWCSTSELCALPLHAAGPYWPRQSNFPDTYTSSYIPTLSALITARSNLVISQPTAPKLLIVGQLVRGQEGIRKEIEEVQQLGDFVDAIVDTDASRDAVLRGLQQHSWAHIACSGHPGDNSQPLHASFELHGGSRLTLLDLLEARLPNADSAFLTTCYSVAGNLTTLDETIPIATALQFCGLRSVVGTLWIIDDEGGPTISKEFYKYMFRNGNKVDFRDSAEALNVATREMRKNSVSPDRWITFIHIGA